MIHKDNLVFQTYERFLSMKISADKNNTTYRQYSLEMKPVVGEPDIMWQSVVYILDEQMVWTNGTIMQRTIYIEKPVSNTNSFVAVQSAFEGRDTMQAINGESIAKITMQYDDNQFGYARIKRVYSLNPLAKIENLTDKSFDVHVKDATEDFDLFLAITVEHDDFECQVIKAIEVKYVEVTMPLIFRNTSDQLATFKLKMTGTGVFYFAKVDDYNGDQYDYDFLGVEYESKAFDSNTDTVELEPGQSFFIYSTTKDYTPSSTNYMNFVIDKDDLEVTGEVFALCGGKPYAYGCYHMFYLSNALTHMPKLRYYSSLPSYCFSSMFYNCTSLVDICDIESDSFSTQCCFSMFLGCSSLTDLSSRIVYGKNFSGTHCCDAMFHRCTSLISAPQLPSMYLSNNCYQDMFKYCIALVNPPELPADVMKSYCYYYMFYQCYSLQTAPKLKSTTLATYCYEHMFYECTSLVNAPELPAKNLASNCYGYMFRNCSALENAPELPAETLSTNCYYGMFYGCTSLVNAPELPAKNLASYCYGYMFKDCSALENAPELPAKNLATSCYSYMFDGCAMLNYIKAMFTTTPSVSYTNSWVRDVSATGTFVKNSAATWTTTGTSGVPTGWSVEYADE